MSALRIAGAGLAGLIAAHAWPQAEVFERASNPRPSHRAVLRFRSDVVAQLTGIEFRRVTVRKGIWSRRAFSSPSVQLANLYSRKCLDRIENDRSIWSLDPVERFIAPESLYETMLAAVTARIHWGAPVEYNDQLLGAGALINTAPLPSVLEALGLSSSAQFTHRRIHVNRYRVDRADVFQSVYFPDPETSVYRASITGDLFIVESTQELIPGEMQGVLEAFGLGQSDVDFIDKGEQRFGKIVPLPNQQRRALLLRLTQDFNIFSLGRYATWRNVLLDDVVQDIAVLRRLMKAGAYERRIFAAS